MIKMDTNTALKPATHTRSTPVSRNGYGAITNDIPVAIKALVDQLATELGWTLGIQKVGKSGYAAHNLDVFGYDADRHLAIIQPRRAHKKKEGYYSQVEKAYMLVGIDDGQLFSHPLQSSPARNPNLKTHTAEDTVRWAEGKIFGVPVSRLDTIVRQGDVAFVPCRSIPAVAKENPVDVMDLIIRGSHSIKVDGNLFKDPDGQFYFDGVAESVHTKGQHKAIQIEGRYKIVAGKRGRPAWWADSELGD
jgi:hypothetical protein